MLRQGLKIAAALLVLALAPTAWAEDTPSTAIPAGPGRLDILGFDQKEYVSFVVPHMPRSAKDETLEHSALTLMPIVGDTLTWSEAVEVISGPRDRMPSSPEAIRTALLSSRREQFAIVTDSLLASGKNDALYEASSSHNTVDGYPDEYTLTHIQYGKHNVFFLTYTCRTVPIPSEKRAMWIRCLGQSQVHKN